MVHINRIVFDLVGSKNVLQIWDKKEGKVNLVKVKIEEVKEGIKKDWGFLIFNIGLREDIKMKNENL